MTPDVPRDLATLIGDVTYAGRVLQVVAKVKEASSPPQALDVLHQAKDVMGIDHAVFVDYMRDLDAHEDYRFMLAADPRWCFEYQAKAWYGSDPWLLYAAMNTAPVCASQIPVHTQQQRDIMRLAETYGMVSVCIAPAASKGRDARVGMLALGSVRRGFFENHAFVVFQMLARALAAELHSWWTSYERDELIRTLHITDEELQLLRLELRGSCTKKIAEQLGLTISAVNSRWQRLNNKLSAPHRRGAARLAVQYGLI